MNGFFYLIPIALGMGAAGLLAFLWSLKNGQYEDLDGAAARILFDEDEDETEHEHNIRQDAARHRRS